MQIKDEGMKKMLDQADVVIAQFGTIHTLFNDYEGGDHCSGLILGMTGADLLMKVSETAFEMAMKPAASKANTSKSLPSGKDKFAQ